MKNITITLDDKTAAWAKKHAAEQGLSLSRFIGQLLQKNLQQSRHYERAMRSFFAKQPKALTRPGDRYPTREELYDRGRLR
jgi:hypothetical protein